MLQITPEGKNHSPEEKVKISSQVQNYTKHIMVEFILIIYALFASYESITIDD